MKATIDRWWTYQRERFPVVKNGLLIAVFATSAVCHSLLLRQVAADPLNPIQVDPIRFVGSALIAFIVLFLFFFQLRVADEFKDFEDDFRHRPYRPVPRGLITLKELGQGAIAAAVVQLGLTLALSWQLVPLLLLVWGYMALMTKEFFVHSWLKSKPLIYMLSHSIVMALFALYATGCEWVTVGSAAPRGLTWFFFVSYCVGLTIEIGRKIRAPQDEEAGVATYTALWGRQKAVMAWLSIVWLLTLTSLLAASYIRFTVLVALLLLLLLTITVLVAWRFTVQPKTEWAKRIEVLSGVWTLAVYFSLGLLPFMLK